MKIETWCANCKQRIALLGISQGDMHSGAYMQIALKESDTKCKECRGNITLLKLIGDDAIQDDTK